jgi:hypothetical protein
MVKKLYSDHNFFIKHNTALQMKLLRLMLQVNQLADMITLVVGPVKQYV